ncbi:MAG TPA: oxidoreductase [Bacteroidales bacterium]
MRAIITGATGLVGNLILKEVLKDNDFSEVRIFVRKPTGIINPKLIEIVSPLIEIDSLSSEIKGDVLFNALGTTIKKAGSQAEQQRIDRDLPISFARIASKNGVKIMLNISSVGANLKGGFYLRTKAEMEAGTEKFFPQNTFHFRPGFLVGERKEFRLAEKIAFGVMKLMDPVLKGSSQKYRGMPADKLAKAMIYVSKNPSGKPPVLYFPEIMQYAVRSMTEPPLV